MLKIHLIVLQKEHSSSFADKLTCFSLEKGLFHLFAPKSKKSTRHIDLLWEVLCQIYTNRQGFCHLSEIDHFDPNLELRKSYSHLQAACKLAQMIKHSQAYEKPNTSTYILLRHFLKALPLMQDPEKILVAARMKLLILEGLWPQELPNAKLTQELNLFGSIQKIRELESLVLTEEILEESLTLFEENFCTQKSKKS